DRDRGDRTAAEAHLAEMLAEVTARTRPRPKGTVAVAGPPAARPLPRATASPLLPEPCLQLLHVATLAAHEQSLDLSLRAVVEALRTGPPAQPAAARRTAFVSTGLETTPEDQVAARLIVLEGLWRRQDVPAARIYETLAEVVFPESRPGEAFLYVHP